MMGAIGIEPKEFGCAVMFGAVSPVVMVVYGWAGDRSDGSVRLSGGAGVGLIFPVGSWQLWCGRSSWC
jgi:hypothetical protein